jgi:ribonuclease E
VESAALALLRALDEASAKQKNHAIEARTATDVALYLLNEKRDALAAIEENRHVRVRVIAGEGMNPGDFEINVGGDAFEEEDVEAEVETARRPPRRAVEADETEADIEAEEAELEAEAEEAPARAGGEDGDRRGRRRRGRRGGRRRRAGETEGGDAEAEVSDESGEAPAPIAAQEERGERGRRRRRRGRGRGRRVYEVDGGEWLDFVGADLKHLTPRPERVRGNGAAHASETPIEAEAPLEEDTGVVADIILHPAVEPGAEPEAVESVVAHVAEAAAAEAPQAEAQEVAYEPDQERRDKFFSRLSRWAKK